MSCKKFWLWPIFVSGSIIIVSQILKQKRVALQHKADIKPPQIITLEEQALSEPQPDDVQESINTQLPENQVDSDDLKIIEGIGPKISSLLISKGIRTFHQLQTTGVEGIKNILNEEGLRLANPETWPEQAAFAKKGDLVGLNKFQDQLKAGRKIK